MLIRKQTDIASSEITSESIYQQRRRFLGQSTALIAGAGLGLHAPLSSAGLQADDEITPNGLLPNTIIFMNSARINLIPMLTRAP